LTPVFVDVDENHFTIDVKQIEARITEKTKAIVPVHLYGQCAEMEAIEKLAAKFKISIIEDAAQSLGATYTFSNGKISAAGTIGKIGTTSFFPSKNLGCYGDGGAIFTNDHILAEKMRMIANHGQRVKYHHDIIGINSRLDTLQASILNVKLKYLKEYEKRRNEAANYYDEQLAGVSEVQIPKRFAPSTHVFHQYTLKVARRDELKVYLEEKGIPTMIYYPVPLHFQKAYQQNGVGEGSFPITERLSKSVLSLPIHTEMKKEEIDFIVSTLKKFYSGNRA
jgi:UDP-2-acetamido-2-deoxy-ribo-hexuluronate aminotransferase